MSNQIIHHEKINTLFPFIKDKMVIDFVNGLNVAQRLNQHQHEISTNFIQRNISLLSGKTQMAQNNINDHMIAGLQACKAYFDEISQHQQEHANAILQINQTLNQTQQYVAEIADYLVDFKEQVQEMNIELSSRIHRLEWADKADFQLNYLLEAWLAEKYHQLSPIAQCYLVLDNLNRGDYGFFIRQLDETQRQMRLDTLKNKIINVQKQLLGCNAHDDLLKAKWLTPVTIKADNADLQLALQYQGSWTWENPNEFPVAFTATQVPMLEPAEQQQYNNLMVSMIDINRVSQRMTTNIFG